MPDCLCHTKMGIIFKNRNYQAYECPNCLRVLIVSKLTGHQKWFIPEAELDQFITKKGD